MSTLPLLFALLFANLPGSFAQAFGPWSHISLLQAGSATPGDFVYLVFPSQGTLTATTPAVFTARLTGSSLLNTSVTLSCQNLPSYLTCSFSPDSTVYLRPVTGQTVQVTVSHVGSAAAGGAPAASTWALAAAALLPLGVLRNRKRAGLLALAGLSLCVPLSCGYTGYPTVFIAITATTPQGIQHQVTVSVKILS